jgi:hypothetical protein
LGTDTLALAAVAVVLVTSLVLLISEDWRWTILALAGQYLGVSFLVWLSWPLEMAVVKLVAGWMAGAVLGTTRIGLAEPETPLTRPFNVVFRLFAGGLIILVVASLGPIIMDWIASVSLPQVWGAGLLIGMGLLHLGFSDRPYRVVLALLTILSGFEILYAAVEESTLVAGMLAGVNLGLALVGAYVLISPRLEEI